MKLISYRHHYYKVKKAKFVIEFIDYVTIWWDHLVIVRRMKDEW